jgi:hypothetical protein
LIGTVDQRRQQQEIYQPTDMTLITETYYPCIDKALISTRPLPQWIISDIAMEIFTGPGFGHIAGFPKADMEAHLFRMVGEGKVGIIDNPRFGPQPNLYYGMTHKGRALFHQQRNDERFAQF